MEKVTIEWLKHANRSIAQIYSSGLEYALVNDKLQQCHDFVYCKDFIQDAVHGSLYGHTASIYGFSYNPKTQPPLSLDQLRVVLVNNADKNMRDKIPNVIDFLAQFCKKMKLKPSKAYEAANPPKGYKSGAFMIVGSGMWLNAPVLVSMYSLLMRVGFVHTKGEDAMKTIDKLVSGKVKPYQSNDTYQMTSAKKGIEQILKNGYRKHFFIDTKKNYPEGCNIGTMHNSSGIVAFSQGSSKSVCKYWTNVEKREAKKAKVKAEEIAANKNNLAEGEVVVPPPAPVVEEDPAKAERRKLWEQLNKEFGTDSKS